MLPAQFAATVCRCSLLLGQSPEGSHDLVVQRGEDRLEVFLLAKLEDARRRLKVCVVAVPLPLIELKIEWR